VSNINELNITNFVNTGLTSPIPRYTFTLEIKWTDDDGEARTHGPQSYIYPNDIAAMPLAVRRRFAIDMINATARVAIGVAQWSEYE
jgi:hypothetical protein